MPNQSSFQLLSSRNFSAHSSKEIIFKSMHFIEEFAWVDCSMKCKVKVTLHDALF